MSIEKTCVNESCKEEIPNSAKICPYCGTSQNVETIQRKDILTMFSLVRLMSKLNPQEKKEQIEQFEKWEKDWELTDKEKLDVLNDSDPGNWATQVENLTNNIKSSLVQDAALEMIYYVFRIDKQLSYEEDMAVTDISRRFQIPMGRQLQINQGYKTLKHYRLLQNKFYDKGEQKKREKQQKKEEKKQSNAVSTDLNLQKLIISSSVTAGALGAIPFPFSDLILVTPVQIGLVYKIGKEYGYDLSKEQIKAFVSVFLTTTIWRTLGAGVAKFIPGWGSVIGATVGFTSTYGIGVVAEAWFKAGMDMDKEDMKESFKDSMEEAKDIFEEYKDTIMKKAKDFRKKKKEAEKGGALVVVKEDTEEEESYKKKMIRALGLEDEVMEDDK